MSAGCSANVWAPGSSCEEGTGGGNEPGGGASSAGLRIENFGGGVDKSAEENAAAFILAASKANGEEIIFGDTDITPVVYSMNPVVIDVTTLRFRVKAEAEIYAQGTPNSYFILANVLTGTVKGPGRINCNDLHSRAVAFINGTVNDGEVALASGGLEVVNCRQYDAETNPAGPQTFTTAALLMRGHYRYAGAVAVKCSDLWSDAPAVDSGGSGQGAVRGVRIDYHSTTGRVADQAIVEHCTIRNLYPANDADGVFMQQAPWKYDRLNTTSICYNTFIDCEKRAIKSQVGINKIVGNTVIRTRKPTLAALAADATFGTDIDVQYSGGEIHHNNFVYKSGYFCPRSTYGIASQQAFVDAGNPVLDPLWEVQDVATNITNTTITIEDDNKGLLYRLFTATARYTDSLDKLKPLAPVTIDTVDCNKEIDTLGLLIGPGSVGNSIDVFTGISVSNATLAGLTQSYLINATESTTEPPTADSYGAVINLDNIKTADASFYTPFTETVVDNGDNIKVNLGLVRDDTPIVGKTYHKLEGRALNTDALSFDILNTQNDLVKVIVTYARTSNNSTQVRHKQVFEFIDSSGSGRRQLSDVTEFTDEQSGAWAISGAYDRNNADGYHVTRLTKAAGTDTDTFGTSNGWWSIEVEAQSPVFVYESSDAEGTTPTVYELRDSTMVGSDYYPVFDDVQLRTISSALALVQVGQKEIRKYLFTATTSADLPQTAQLRVGDRVLFAVVHGFTGTVNVDDAGTETIEVTDDGGVQTVDTSLAIDNASRWWEFTYQGSGVWGARF